MDRVAPWFERYPNGRVRFECECGRHWIFSPTDLLDTPAQQARSDEKADRRRTTARRRFAAYARMLREHP